MMEEEAGGRRAKQVGREERAVRREDVAWKDGGEGRKRA